MPKLDPTRRSEELNELSERIHSLLIGQDEAVAKVVESFQVQSVGLEAQGRPLSTMLFLGPTGTGKTRLVECLAEIFYGSPQAVVKVDCAEFQHSHEIAKLIGSPPGYLGHRETVPILSQKSLDRFRKHPDDPSFVLFDEIEKGSDALWNLLLGVLDKGTLTLGDNSPVDFSHAMIFMTSNLGAKEVENLASKRLGFHQEDVSEEKAESIGVAAARKRFSPEFVNRLDSMVVFKALGVLELDRILSIELGRVQQRITEAGLRHTSSPVFTLGVQPSVRELLMKQGTDVRYGARQLRRVIEKTLVTPIANLISSEQIHSGDYLMVEMDGEDVAFYASEPMASEATQ